MRDEPPFPREKVRKHQSKGVHAPDPLRDDPNHPHSRLGPDHRKSNFADGGVIGESDLESDAEFQFGGAIRNAFGKVSAVQQGFTPDATTTGLVDRGQRLGQRRGLASPVNKRRNAVPPSLARPVIQPNVGGNFGGFSTPEFKDGGKIKKRSAPSDAKKSRRNPAPNAFEQKEQDLDARLAKASRTRTPGHNENSFQNKFQQSLAKKAVDRSEDDRAERAGLKRRTKARSSSKRHLNQK